MRIPAEKIAADRRRKVDKNDLALIRRAVEKGEQTQVEIGRRFGVSQSYVSRVTQDAHEICDLLARLHLDQRDLDLELPTELRERLGTLLAFEALVRRARLASVE